MLKYDFVFQSLTNNKWNTRFVKLKYEAFLKFWITLAWRARYCGGGILLMVLGVYPPWKIIPTENIPMQNTPLHHGKYALENKVSKFENSIWVFSFFFLGGKNFGTCVFCATHSSPRCAKLENKLGVFVSFFQLSARRTKTSDKTYGKYIIWVKALGKALKQNFFKKLVPYVSYEQVLSASN